MRKADHPARAGVVEPVKLSKSQRTEIKKRIIRPRHKPPPEQVESFCSWVEMALSTHKMEVIQLTELVDTGNRAFERTDQLISHLESAAKTLERMDCSTESLIHQHYVIEQGHMLPATTYGHSAPIEGLLWAIVDAAREH